MSAIRQRMLEDLRLRGLSARPLPAGWCTLRCVEAEIERRKQSKDTRLTQGAQGEEAGPGRLNTKPADEDDAAQ